MQGDVTMRATNARLFGLTLWTIGPWLSSCGYGTAVVAGALSQKESSPAANNAPAVKDFQLQARTSPAELTFTLEDIDSDPASVEILVGTSGQAAAALLVSGKFSTGEQANTALRDLETSPAGVVHRKLWDFESQLGPGQHEGVRILVTIQGGSSRLERTALAGNEAPELALSSSGHLALSGPQLASGELRGLVQLGSMVRDSARDSVSIEVQFAQVDALPVGEDPAEDQFQDAVLVGNRPEKLTLDSELIAFEFFWDTEAHPELAGESHEVVLRLTPSDPLVVGQAVLSDRITVDNDREPVASLNEGGFLLNPDQRRGIPVPFTVIDAEEQEVAVVLQWRFAGQDFDSPSFAFLSDPRVGADPQGVLELMRDPDFRAQYQIAGEQPLLFRGHAVPAPSRSPREIRLPETAARASSLLSLGTMVGRSLEILRSSRMPVALDWATSSISSLVAACPLGDGQQALVLDGGAGGWNLKRITLATGESTLVVSLSGLTATALARGLGDEEFLVAAHDGSDWSVHRVRLEDPLPEPIAASASLPGVDPGPIRGLDAIGRNATVISVGDSLIRLFHPEGETPQATRVATLQEPFGVLVDPLDRSRAYVAERGRDRVVKVDLLRLEVSGRVPTGSTPILRPSHLALDSDGSRLLVVTEALGMVLHAVHLGRSGDAFVVTDALGPVPPGALRPTIASGADGLRVAALPGVDELFAGGGLEQVREIIAFHPPSQVATLLSDLEPPLDPAAPRSWRVRAGAGLVRATVAGTKGVFLWDTAQDLPRGGNVFLRATALDTEAGSRSETRAAKAVLGPLETSPQILADPVAVDSAENAIDLVDFDDDGDLDVVLGNRHSGDPSKDPAIQDANQFEQIRAGVFGGPVGIDADPANGCGATVERIRSVASGHLNNDAFLDLVLANEDSEDLTVFFGSAVGFNPNYLTLNVSPTNPFTVTLADMDSDGQTDILASGGGGGDPEGNIIHIFLQPDGGFSNSGCGTRSDCQLQAAGTQATASIVVGDLDGNGFMDVAAAANVTHNVAVFFQGPGVGSICQNFTAKVLDSVGLSPFRIAAADVDRDGLFDLVTANLDSDDLSIVLQVSPGEFDSLHPILLQDPGRLFQPAGIAVGDLDGNGLPDVIAGPFVSNNVSVFYQDAPLLFRVNPLRDSNIREPIFVDIADLDGDGRLDVISANQQSNNATIFLQSRPGNLATTATEMRDVGLDDPGMLAAGDLDGNGLMDLVSANSTSANLTAFLQTDPTVFNQSSEKFSVPSFSPQALELSDLDGNGALDLIAVGRRGPGSAVEIFLRDRVGVLAVVELVEDLGAGLLMRFPMDVTAEDVDDDGLLDLIVANRNSDNVTVFLQPPGGFFDGMTPSFELSSGLGSPRRVRCADMNLDGRIDVVVACDGHVGCDPSASKPCEPGNDPCAPVHPGVAIFHQPASGWTTSGSADVSIEESTLDPYCNATFPFVPVGLTVADLNDDRVPDLAVACSQICADGECGGAKVVAVYLQPPTLFPSQGAAATQVFGDPAVDRPGDLVAADVDRDGDLDLVVLQLQRSQSPGFTESRLMWYEQSSPGVFETFPLTRAQTGVTLDSRSIVVEDIDRDGELDIALANTGSDSLAVFFGGR